MRSVIELRASKNMRHDLNMRADNNVRSALSLRVEKKINTQCGSASHVSTTARSQSASRDCYETRYIITSLKDPMFQYSDASHMVLEIRYRDASHKRNVSHISVASLKLI